MDKPRLDQGPDYERGFIDGMMYQTQTSVDKAVNAMSNCPNCEYHRQRAQRWREEAYKLSGYPLPEREEEPVAWMVYTQEGQSAFVTDNPAQIHPSQRALPLYATPQWVGLTELEKAEITSLKWWDWEDTFDIDGFIKAIESKLKEKNT